MILTTEGDEVLIEASHLDTPYMKTIPGMRYDKRRKVWKIKNNRQAFAALKDLDTERECFGKQVTEEIKQALRRNNTNPIKNHDHLYPFQNAGVRFLAGAKCALMADEMGTGKTVQSLTAVELEKAYPALVVCPNSLKHNWAREVEQWTNATPFVVEGTAKQRREIIAAAEEAYSSSDGAVPVVVIINYESLIKHTKQASFGNKVLTEEQKKEKELNAIEWTTTIVDEAHRIKNPGIPTTRSVWGVSAGSKYRFALTGTPIVNNPDDFWSIMRFVRPDEYPSRSRFQARYCDVRPGWFGGLENHGLRPEARAEFDTLTQPRLIRRTKAEVLPDLPAKVETVRMLPLTREQKRAYNQMVEHMISEAKGGHMLATDPLTLIGKLRFLAAAEVQVDDTGNVIALHGKSNKLTEVRSILEDSGEPLVVYASSRKFIEFLQRELSEDYTTVSVTGKHSAAQRQVAVDTFQAGGAQLFLATTGAGAEGLTLTASNRLVLAMEDWSNVANKQAHDRIHRIGATGDCVEIITLMSEHTIEEAVHAATQGKEAMLQQLVRDKEMLMRAIKGEI